MLLKFLKRKNQDLVMFGYIRAVKKNMPTVSVMKAAEQYMSEFGLDMDEHNIETIRVTFERMNTEYHEYLKNESKSKV